MKLFSGRGGNVVALDEALDEAGPDEADVAGGALERQVVRIASHRAIEHE